MHVIVKGLKGQTRIMNTEENNCDEIMSRDRQRSPWAFQNTEMRCPNCQSCRIFRVLDRWGRSKGIQMFECAVCGKRFYDRGVDDYRPTFQR